MITPICHPSRCHPYFLVAGFTKCGTTDLYEVLSLHPQVSPANIKEPFWWNRQHQFSMYSFTNNQRRKFIFATYSMALFSDKPLHIISSHSHQLLPYPTDLNNTTSPQ